MQAVKIKDGIYWVGGIDWDLRNFHGYLTQKGSTYNSYLLMDEKVTLIDNVKYYLFEEQLTRISKIVDPGRIEYIIQNHIEMDHSGSLPDIMKYCPQATILASPKGAEGLPLHFKKSWKLKEVKSGDTINLGKRNLHFVQTPMVHWPDNMVSYCPEERLLFSNDAFGQHIASSERFDDEYPFQVIMQEARKYYANIVLPYSQQVRKALLELKGLELEFICPSHGVIWKNRINDILRAYESWSANETDKKAVIIYGTMWQSTAKIAYTLQSVFEDNGIRTEMKNLQWNHISDIMTDVMTARYICVGSPTLNNNILPDVAAFLTYLKGLAPRGRVGLAFGSYGWGGQSINLIEETLRACGFRMLPSIRFQYVPDKNELDIIGSEFNEHLKINLKEEK